MQRPSIQTTRADNKTHFQRNFHSKKHPGDMRPSALAMWALTSAIHINSDWAPFDWNTSECQQCYQGQGIMLYEDWDIWRFCRYIMDACADGQVDAVTYLAEGDGANALFQWHPIAEDGNVACPSSMDICKPNVRAVRGGQCPTNAVTASGEIQLDTGGRAGLVVISGGCFCASILTC